MTGELDTLIAELRKQADAATPGPWENEDHRERGDWRSSGLIWSRNRGEYHPGTPICRVDERKVTEENVTQFEDNAALIAAARTLVPALLDALEAMRAQRDEAVIDACYEIGYGEHPKEHNARIDRCDAEIARVLRGKP